MSPSAPPTPDAPLRPELFGPRRRATTVGVLLLTLAIAFEAMGVGTAMPAVVADLGAVSAYAWPIATFLAASVLGTVLGGRWCDAHGPRRPLLLTPLVFGIGLVVAGTATGLPQLLVGRVLQGLSAGAQMIAVMVTIAAVYPERARPAVFGLMSGAWVLPSLVGPPLAGLVTERFSWHWVFLGIVPVVTVALALVVPVARQLTAPEAGPPGRRGLVAAAAGAALGVSALSWAAQRPGALGAGIAAGALAMLVPSLRRLLPAGVFRARRGVPAVVGARGLLAGVFFTVNSYVPLMLTATHGWSLAAAGTPLVTASLAWTVSSAWQGRHPTLSRAVLLRVGFCLITIGVVGMAPVAAGWAVPWLALPAWALAGLGMGLGFSSVGFLLLRHSANGEVGEHSAAAQLADQLTTAALVGLGGALLAVAPTPAVALAVLLVPLAALAALGALLAPRTA